MDYLKIYNSIIEKARRENKDGYLENHHIIPKCIGGTNSKENIVPLTLRQHYICHKLLLKIYPEEKSLKIAMFLICNSTLEAEKRFLEKNLEIKKDNSGFKNARLSYFLESEDKIRISSREYEYFKKLGVEARTGTKRTSEQIKNISEGTKQGMRRPDVVERWGVGAKNSKHYYNKITGEGFKWFEGDPDIDTTIFAWGRKPMSKEQKEKLKTVQKTRKTLFNKELDAMTSVFTDIIRYDKIPDTWKGEKITNSGKSFSNMNKKIKPIFKKIYYDLANEGIFVDYIFKKISKNRKVISFGVLVLTNEILKEYVFDKISEQEAYNALKKYVVENQSIIENKNKEMYY